jgi:D-alanyl-lipoteichoic acid acyltransferase DltB (MBOAT superfamily)
MLFSSPDYPVFLIAVFFLYGLSRRSGWARAALMLLLGDLVFLLVSKDPSTLWDPLGGALYRLALLGDPSGPVPEWPAALIWKWQVGAFVLAGAVALGRLRGAWIASDRGQRWIAPGLVAVLGAVGTTVAIASHLGVLDQVTAVIVAYGHLLVLAVLGLGIGAAQHDASRSLGRVVVLFVASSLFYHAWAAAMPGPYRYLLAVLLATIVLDYYLALWIERTRHPVARRALVFVSLASNLGILLFFKYTDFFTQDVLGPGGLDVVHVRKLDLILPAGISFHTFQSLSYTIDVYRGQLKATRSVVQFATFVLFFPQLVAGPIVRAQDLLPQLAELPALELDKATRGLFRIVVGLFKKIALADALALALVDRVFEAPERFSGLEALVGVYGYALQIYLDFSAYSDIAIGSAEVLGFSLPENFRTPYRSADLQEFWRRWHISLSTWLRDYLYFTLGGSQGPGWLTYLNLSLTMLLGGLWHGASWTFIVWGALHGFGLAITRFFQRHRGTGPGAAYNILAWCAAIAAAGVVLLVFAVPDGAGTWPQLVLAWATLTPLWAVATAWLGGEWGFTPRKTERFWISLSAPDRLPAEVMRLAMCACGAALFAALWWGSARLQLELAVATWLCAFAADMVESGARSFDWLRLARRALAVVLVFHYVCLAWVFFRAASFDNALAVLRQIGAHELDHANLVPAVTLPLAVGFLCHFFADGSFQWLRDRFCALPAWAQGALLAAIALVLRSLGHHKLVPFIYFQF